MVTLSDIDLRQRLHPGLQRLIAEKRWEFTDIQRQAIPVILEGADCVIEAPTAGGKTEAVLWPVLTRVATDKRDSVGMLYLAPLRALLNSLEKRVEANASACMLDAFKWHGDVSQAAKLERVSQRVPHVLLTTPESLEAILLRKSRWRQMFKHLRTVVIDEAHNFAGGDRGGHVLSLLARLEQATDTPPQRIALSATVGNVEAMQRWLVPTGRTLARHVCVRSVKPVQENFRVHYFAAQTSAEEATGEEPNAWRMLESLYDLVSGEGKQNIASNIKQPPTNELTTIRKGPERTIVFVRSRRGAEDYAKKIGKYARATGKRELKIRTHHSAVSKFYREEAEALIQMTTETGIDAIISTSTLELGIDIGGLNQVIQCDTLTSPGSFLQRVGRTGRRSGQARFFRGLCTDPDDLLPLVATVSLGQQKRAEALALPRRAFPLLAHQLLCLALQQNGITPSAAWEALRTAHVFSGVSRSEHDDLIRHMVEQNYLREDSGVLVIGDSGEKYFLGAGWRKLFAVFDSAPMYEVINGKTQVGTLDAAFVEGLKPPFLFVLGGHLWMAKSVNAKSRTIAAHRSRAGDAPKWHSFGGPDLPFETAQEVGRILHEGCRLNFLDEPAEEQLQAAQRSVARLAWHPGLLVVDAHPSGKTFVWTYAGDRINRTLAHMVASIFGYQATSNYRFITVQVEKNSPKNLVDRVPSQLAELPSRMSSAHELEAWLSRRLSPYPFSPFARCLPPHLLTAALAERILDTAGLFRLMANTKVRTLSQTIPSQA